MRPVTATCRACGNRTMQEFYAVDDVPVNNCLILEDRREALAFPRGNLRIAFCERCGFIQNTVFDLSRLVYDHSYEETQTFSPTFVAFQDRIVQTLIDEYDLVRKNVVEIGCGKGTFLQRLCELGENHGIGIDPTSIQDRLEGPGAERVRFINEFYGVQHATIPTDFLCSRHALEHIPEVAEFMRTCRAALGSRDVPVFFEIPETLRVLREAAYWDIYYEHCSYFTPGSLARLFESTGFDVDDVRVDYGDQYLLLDARPARGAVTTHAAASVDQPEDVRREVEAFERTIERKIGAWRDYFDRVRRDGRKVVVWGSGSKCVAFLTTIGVRDEVEFVTDINPHRQGRFIVGAGKEIVPPAFLTHYRPDDVIVMNPIYRDEIGRMLHELDVTTNVMTAEDAVEALA